MYYINGRLKYSYLLEKVVDLVFPMSTYCIICGNFVDNTRKYSICDTCFKKVNFGRIEIDLKKESKAENREIVFKHNISCMNYGLLEREIGFSLKYKRKTYIARIIAEIMFDRIMNDPIISTDFLSADYIIPVPISNKRFKERGFNQTEKIAKYLSKKIEIPFLKGRIVRVKDTSPQKDLDKISRLENIKDAFEIVGGDFKNKKVILLDDFYTTGITTYEIGSLLKKSGASEIYLITLATKNIYKIINNA